ncbi:MAG: HEPN domain-containing protein [Eubacteriales bacterium]|nr:HEPN domain-containing protein [Eubacteriales bacterium]
MDERRLDLSNYRLQEADDSLEVAKFCYEKGKFKDSINRSYYAAFYAIKAILAMEAVDFKRHKDVMAYFNKEYVAKELFAKDLGRRIGKLQQLREKSDYSDFFIASKEQAEEQYKTADEVIKAVKEYTCGEALFYEDNKIK